jgi:methylglutamate dehydrogenase subunit C
MSRLPTGGLIDRTRKLSFTFDGREYSGHQGDTLASALLANGQKLFGRSFKYHRPRGVLSAGPEEPSALVELRSGARREPNMPATLVELFDGLQASSQNRFPSLRFDLMAMNSWLSPLFPAGFYYKTFMWPASWWEKFYEPAIRRAAGLGRASGEPDPDHYAKENLFCDVLVIGAGPAGLAAALAAGRHGARVVLCEADARLGGRLLSDTAEIDGKPGLAWSEAAEAALRDYPEMRILRRTTVFGAYDHGTYGALERVADHKPAPDAHEPRQRYWRIVAKRAVLAAGAIERLAVFGGNDRPGVMLSGAVRSYLSRYAVAPGKRAVVLASGDDGWRTVAELADRNIEIAAVVDRRTEISDAHAKLAGRAGAQVFAGGRITRTLGGNAMWAVDIVDSHGHVLRTPADLLAVAGGWNPAVHLASHLGARPVWSEEKNAFLPGTPPLGMVVVGAANGAFSTAVALAEGTRAGNLAAEDTGFPGPPLAPPTAADDAAENGKIWLIPGSRGKAFVDLQHDVTEKDIALAHREGFVRVEHMKRYTTHGMATDQGKTGGVAGMAAMAALTGNSMAETGTTMFRPPYTPIAIGALAGHHRGPDFRPTRRTPGHRWAEEQRAVWVETGPWLRAQWFPLPGEKDWQQSVHREVYATRNGVGVCDVSTLGKIEIVGPDAGAFLDFLYTNTFSTLPVGRTRYGVMLREDGFVFDDGTTARLVPDRWIMTTTTANAPRVLQHMEFVHQVLRPEWRVAFVSVTDRWAQFAVAGPQSRKIVAAVLDGGDVSDAAFPFMAAGTFSALGGVETRLFRISFSGERAYEIGVPAAHGDALVRKIMAAGAADNIVPYGLEALGTMRIEKGHPAGGELNGQTTARDLGMAKLMSSKKDFVGRALAQRPALLDPRRPTLVGIKPLDRAARLRAGAHLLPRDAANSIEHDQGWVTSVAFSPSLGHWIGLAMLADGPTRHGEHVRAYDPVRDGDAEVEVVAPCFIDPEGARLRG